MAEGFGPMPVTRDGATMLRRLRGRLRRDPEPGTLRFVPIESYHSLQD